MRDKLKEFLSSRLVVLGLGVLLGVVAILLTRYFTYQAPASTHYHANFAVFINGKREEFKDKTYYQEVAACMQHDDMMPVARVHMHEQINDVIHVHDHAVSWGQFFTNLGWTLGPDFIVKPDGTINPKQGTKQLHLMLNGQDYTGLGGLNNRVIKDEDKLLVSYGDIGRDQLKQEYSIIPSTAHHYDVTKDPSSCSGGHVTTWRDKLHHLF